MQRNLFRDLDTSWDKKQEISKGTFYRLLNSHNINWRRFTRLLVRKSVNERLPYLTDKNGVNVFIVNDTLYERRRSKTVEPLRACL